MNINRSEKRSPTWTGINVQFSMPLEVHAFK